MRNYYSRIMVVIALSIWINLPLLANKTGLNQIRDSVRIEMEGHLMRFPLRMDTDELMLFLEELIPGAHYTLFLTGTDRFQQGEVIFKPSNSYTLLRENVIEFIAFGPDLKIEIYKKHQARKKGNGPIGLNLSLACTSCNTTNSDRNAMGVMTDSGYSPEELIRDVFIGGDCFDVDPASIVYTGDILAAGYFSNGINSIDIEDGVILSTGGIDQSAGPNNAYNTGTSLFGPNNDPDLADMVNTGAVFDVAALEFDFTPTTDVISFEFVFASEEYCEYVNSSFNDVFGFFVSGPGFNGPYTNNAENIAIVPGTNDNIAINSVNHLQNAGYYVNNIPSWHHSIMPAYLQCDNHTTGDGSAIDQIEYDGFTTVMTATMNVQPCETYHIKLAIADATDAYYDSAVFLKANSFNSGGTAVVNAEVPGGATPSNIAYENCVDGYFVFQRPNDNLDEAMTVHFDLSNTSTAVPGLDFESLPDSIIIPAGDSLYYLPVHVYTDFLEEGPESIILELDVPCTCSMTFTEMWIEDGEELSVNLEDVTLCEPEQMLLTPQVSGGLGNYIYNWNTGDTIAAIYVDPVGTNTYSLTITDDCGNTGEAFSTVEIIGTPTAVISGYEQICPENPIAEIIIEFTGSGPWDLIYSLDGNPQPMLSGITDNPYLLTVQDIGVYHVQSVSQNGCSGEVQGAASVVPTNFEITAVLTDESCPGESDGGIDITVTGGAEPYLYLWDNGGGMDEDPINLTEGMYNLVLTDANGCTTTFSAEILLDANVPEANAGLDQQLNCVVSQVTLSGSGSDGPGMDFLWTTNDGNIVSGATTLNPVIDQNGTYHLNITNTATNCTVSDEAEVFLDTVDPVAEIEVNGPLVLDCSTPNTILDGSGSSPMNNLDFQWSTTDGNILGNTYLPAIEVDAAGTYELIVTNMENGCSSGSFLIVESHIELPDIQILPTTLLTCADTVVSIDATNSSTGPEFEYLWTTTNGNLLYGETTLLPAVDQPGIYFLMIYDTSNDCQTTSHVEVGQDVAIPLAEAGLSIELNCNDSVTVLDGNQSSIGVIYSYDWSTSNGSIIEGEHTLNPIVNSIGDYELTVVNTQNGCDASDVVSVFENSNPPTDLETEIFPPECYDDLGSLSVISITGGEGPYLYSIDGGGHFYQEGDFYDLEPGNYELLIQDAGGCQYQESVSIPHVPGLTVFLEPEVELELGMSYELKPQINLPAFQIESVSWSPGDFLSCTDCINPIATPLENTLYNIVVTDKNGCQASAEVFIRIDPHRNVFVPNVFSPNGDGSNDVFFIFGSEKSVVKITRLQVFNRWGEKLFDARDLLPNDPLSGWDGTFKGKILNPSVVVYLAEIEFIDGESLIYSGDLTVVD